jgi:predicted RNA-binding Zn-ribbon protein involved in translation (DUF1610 family)
MRVLRELLRAERSASSADDEAPAVGVSSLSCPHCGQPLGRLVAARSGSVPATKG